MKRIMRDELEQSELLGIFSVLILKFDTHYCYDAFYPYTEEIFFKSLSISGFFNSVEWQYDWFSIFMFFTSINNKHLIQLFTEASLPA